MTTLFKCTITIGFFLFTSIYAGAAPQEDQRGLLPEVQLNSSNEDENEKRSLQTELLVTRAETQAIESLKKILAKKKGTASEPDLLHRLAELYMRRSRTGRFFDLHKDTKTLKLSTFPMPSEKGSDWIKKASAVYTDIEKRFPKYHDLDSVIFNNAFANQQLGQIRQAEILYQRMIDTRPQSRLIPDAAVALGELAYDQRRFALALENFALAQKFPESRVYTYALYKAAWTHYNMKDSEQGIQKLLDVVAACPPDAKGDQAKNRQNLRREAMRDLTIFVGDTKPADQLYGFFKKIATEEELSQSMMDLAALFMSHSRFKEMDIFLGEFTKKHPKNPGQVKATLMLVDAHENLKARDKVLTNLRRAAELCRLDSPWRKEQATSVIEESCQKNFRSATNSIAVKWWEIWQKNKTHQEFSGLLEQALKIVLENEDPTAPDVNSRFGYAELLFQLGRYTEASSQYAKTAEQMVLISWSSIPQKDTKQLTNNEGIMLPSPKFPNEDRKRLHDADYGALFSLEKAIEKKKSNELTSDRKKLAQIYLGRHPKGLHAGDVTLKMAVVFYDEKNYKSAKEWLAPLLAGTFGRPLQTQSEDLFLEILNIEKNFTALASSSREFLKREKTEARRNTLKKIEIESDYAGLQEELQKTDDKQKAANRLRDFSQLHQGSTLSSDALFQAAALDFLNGRGLSGAKSIESFILASPKDPRITDALKESARAYAEAGEMSKAAELFQNLAEREPKLRQKHLETAADFLLLEGQFKKARGIYNQILPTASKETRTLLYSKILDTLKTDPNPSESSKIENLMLSENLEPYATEILVRRAEAQLQSGKKSEAFEAARKIMSRSAAPAELRARARLIQAGILEGEFLQQSVKSSSAERFGMVLGMKIEKLEKAQTAFLGASKMSPDAAIQGQAFSGIDRVYGHLIESLETLKFPADLPPADLQALQSEISSMIGPLKAKRDENRHQMKSLVAVSAKEASKWADLGGDASPPPAAPDQGRFLNPYLTKVWSDDISKVRRFEGDPKKTTCSSKSPEFSNCLVAGQVDTAVKIARELTQDKATRLQGWHHLALASDSKGLKSKGLWLLRLAEKENPHHPLVRYEKGRLLSEIEGEGAGSADFAEVLKSSMSSTEIEILKGLRAFSEGDDSTVKKIFSGFSKKDLYHLEVGAMLSESLAKLGETDNAIRLIMELMKTGPTTDLLIQQGRLNEVYKFAPAPAIEAYDKARKMAKDASQKAWLDKKIEYLKVNFKVGLHVTPGGF